MAAKVYAEGVRRGGALVGVKAHGDDADRIDALPNTSQAVDATARADAYRADGWTGFDEKATPYSAEQVTRDRPGARPVRSRLQPAGGCRA